MTIEKQHNGSLLIIEYENGGVSVEAFINEARAAINKAKGV